MIFPLKFKIRLQTSSELRNLVLGMGEKAYFLFTDLKNDYICRVFNEVLNEISY